MAANRKLSLTPRKENRRESMQNEIKAKKDFLYAEAKTSRDLYWTHGWHKGFSWVETQIKELQYWKGVDSSSPSVAQRLRKRRFKKPPPRLV